MTTKYLETTDVQITATSDAVARAYAATIGKPWPMPPDSYGPGRQPEPREAYYQRAYAVPIKTQTGWAAPIGDDVADAQLAAVGVDSSKAVTVITVSGEAVLPADGKTAQAPMDGGA